MVAKQVKLSAAVRNELGKGPTGRLRRDGRTPGVVYGHGVDPTAVHVDALELYHALHTEAGANVLLRLEVDGDEHLAVARDIQRHKVRGDVQHIDFLAVDRDQKITVEVPIHLTGQDEVQGGGVVNLVLYAVPVRVRPLDTPNAVELDVTGMQIGDVKRVDDLRDVLPEGIEFDIDVERTVVTINPPDILEEPEVEEAVATDEGELLDIAEGEMAEAADTDASEVPAGQDENPGG